jgi:leucyl-tRNA synthetase
MMELVNDIYRLKETASAEDMWVVRNSVEYLLMMLSPFVPHIADELWGVLDKPGELFNIEWPGYDEKWVEESDVTIAIQISGKLRGTINMLAGSSQLEVEKAAMSDEKILKHLEGMKTVKVIYVKDKILNIIAKPA